MYTVEAIFFPTKIILIDDDQDFLKAMCQHLSKNFQVDIFNDVNKALDYIEKSQSDLALINPENFINLEEQDLSDVRLDLNKIHAFSNNKEKYKLNTVIISDYEMPEMNGIALFERLSHIPAMKILLTGKADLTLALDAFNRCLVDKFLVKNTEKMPEEILMNIISCQHAFFQKKSYPILSHLNIPYDSLLNKIDFYFHFMSLIRDHDISEYYLIDVIGSFLLITKKEEKSYYICMLERQFDEYLDIAITSRASLKIIDDLKKRKQAPVFISEDDYKLSAEHWEKIMHSFEKKDDHYFCIIEKL